MDDSHLVTPGVTILQIPSWCTSLSPSLQPHNICTAAEWGLNPVLSLGKGTPWVGWIQTGSDGSLPLGVPHVTTWCNWIVHNCNSNKNDQYKVRNNLLLQGTASITSCLISPCKTSIHMSYLQPRGFVPCFLEGFSLWEKIKLPINSILLNVACSRLLKNELGEKACSVSTCKQTQTKGFYTFTQKLSLDYWLPEAVIARKDHSIQEPFLTLFLEHQSLINIKNKIFF